MKLRLATLALLGALATAGSAAAVSDTYGGATFHPFTMPGNSGCVAWIDPVEGRTQNCDPINLIFPNQSATRVRDGLRAKGWTTFGFGSNQYLHFQTSTLVRQQIQLFRSDGRARQYHIRLWQTGTTTLGGVHHESGAFIHTIDKSWDDSEAFVRSQLCGATCSSAHLPEQWRMQDGVDGQADGDLLWRGWANDANAAVIP
jgi:hypothetical protein